MTEILQEFCDWRTAAMRVDRAAGVIRGVKILGLQSRNGRSYLPDALAQAVSLYENARVNVNHPKTAAAAPRDYQDRIGAIRNVTARDDGLFADFHFNPRHALAEQLAWDAEHSPENVGFSHNVEARTARRGDQVVVEAIVRVQSVDLVADPATTRGLFESRNGDPPRVPQTVDDLTRDYSALVEALVAPKDAEIRRLAGQLERLTLAEAAHQKRQLVERLLHEAGLPQPEAAEPAAQSITSPRFVESLLAAADEAAMRVLIEERAALVRALGRESASLPSAKPQSRDQHLIDAPARLDVRAFVEAIT